jgi:predicted protein tyrosine phosphatase
MKLFVCNQGKNRSKTAAKLFGGKSTSLYNEINLITAEQLEEAEIIYVFEERQRTEISRKFPKQYMEKKIINLDIPDIYKYDQPELIEVLKGKYDGSTN